MIAGTSCTYRWAGVRCLMFCKRRENSGVIGVVCKTFLYLYQYVIAITAIWGTGGREFKSRPCAWAPFWSNGGDHGDHFVAGQSDQVLRPVGSEVASDKFCSLLSLSPLNPYSP
jgi:hypothetical protein